MLSFTFQNSKLMIGGDLKGTWNRQILRPVKSAESLVMLQRREASMEAEGQNEDHYQREGSRPISGDSDDIAPLETVTHGMGIMSRRRGTSQKGHERSNSHDSYFERKLSVNLNDDKAYSDPDSGVKMDSSLDISEIQVNFELEENEMRIFTEDMLSNSLGSDISKSPLEQPQQPQQPQQLFTADTSFIRASAKKSSPKMSSESEVTGDDSPKSRTRMSFREKLKRFTSPTPSRMRGDSEDGQSSEPESASIIKSEQVKRTSTSIRDKLVCALSPESLRRRHTVEPASHVTSHIPASNVVQISGDVSPKKNKSSFSPGTSPSANLVKRSKIEDDEPIVRSTIATIEPSKVATVATVSTADITVSPSMKFIDSSMHESTDSTINKLLNTGKKERFFRN